MHLAKEDIPVKIDAPGAVARQLTDFGEASGTLGAEYFSLATGADLAPLLQGLEHNSCHSPHWGYLISGVVVVSYDDGSTERLVGGEVFFWPAGHSVLVEEGAEIVLFSPQVEHGAVMDHILAKVTAAAGA
ncbi:MAG: cupin domain-containing protein [Acidimicrobiales bacterium]